MLTDSNFFFEGFPKQHLYQDQHFVFPWSTPTRPSGPSWSSSRGVCLSVCLMSLPDVFFLGLSLALRSQDQIPASHSQKKIMASLLLSASVERVGVSRFFLNSCFEGVID